MKFEETYWTCRVCGKEINVTSGEQNFTRHMSRHYDPTSRLCREWYAKYFVRVSTGVNRCIVCLGDLQHDYSDPFDRYGYVAHLREHNIVEPMPRGVSVRLVF